jgi:hypothetical protein
MPTIECMGPIEFTTSIVTRREDGAIVIALLDGSPRAPVTIAVGSVGAARRLLLQLAQEVELAEWVDALLGDDDDDESESSGQLP